MIQLIMILLEIKDLGSLWFLVIPAVTWTFFNIVSEAEWRDISTVLVNPAVTWTFFNIVSEAERRDISTVIWNEFVAKLHVIRGYDVVMLFHASLALPMVIGMP